MRLWPAAALILTAAAVVPACKDVTSFSTKPGEAYCGNVVEGSFVRAGLGPGVQLEMSFDAGQAESDPGAITTSDKMLDRAEMHMLPQISNDPLATLNFGEGRQKSYLYFVQPADGSAPISAFVSLMESGDVEVRLVRGGTPPVFGVFPLTKRKGNCGF